MPEARFAATPIPDDIDDAALERRLFTPAGFHGSTKPLPNWVNVHAELERRRAPRTPSA